MLDTPYGRIVLRFDGMEVPYEIRPVQKNSKVFPDIDEAYLLCWEYIEDESSHTLECVLMNEDAVGEGEGGERLEMTSIYLEGGKLSIGVEADFCEPQTFEYDYSGRNVINGIEISINPQTHTQHFIFGVAWLKECSEEKDVQTWYAADPTITAGKNGWNNQ